MRSLPRPRGRALRTACLVALGVLVAGCVYAPPPPPAYGYAPGYAYSPYAYAYPVPAYGAVTLGFGGGGGWYRRGWR